MTDIGNNRGEESDDQVIENAYRSLLSIECKLVENSKSLVSLHNSLVYCTRNIQNQNIKSVQKLTLKPNEKKKEVIWNGFNLLEYSGDPDNYPEVGRFLARKILTLEERKSMCWFPGKRQPRQFGRLRVPEDAEFCFREALTQISGRSRFAFRRAKDAANNLGFHERWASLRNQ
ncbi:uncharacterized protein LOC142338721 [Convolutriloba macropyga]|uniref:uncharacterized protein LOC142338721 n=1 Tax=Convolutriloba macropyga TaxID=536237 RepID=UPI003F51C7C7